MAGSVSATSILHRRRGVVRTGVAITCDAAGVLTAVTVGVGFGLLAGVLYDGGLDIGATITISDAKTGKALITYVTGTEGTPTAFRPTGVIATNAGAAVAAANTAPNVNRNIFVAGKINVAVTGGGVSETCKLALIVDESLQGPQVLS